MTLRWKYRETVDSEYATSGFAGFKVTVQDCDGDFSRWSIKDPDVKTAFSGEPFVIASGDCHTANYATDPYHFLLAQEIAERCVRSIAAARRAVTERKAAEQDDTPHPPSGDHRSGEVKL